MQKFLSLLFFGILLIILFSCNEGEGIAVPRNQVITGINVIDENQNSLGSWGFPSAKTSGVLNGCNTEIDLLAYPNPARSMIVVNTAVSCGKKLSVWIVKATQSSEDDIKASGVVATELPCGFYRQFYNNEAITKSFYTLAININNYPPGFYRLYVKIDNELLWDDLYFYEDIGELRKNFGILAL